MHKQMWNMYPSNMAEDVDYAYQCSDGRMLGRILDIGNLQLKH